MQIECRTTSLLDCYAEMQLILCKGTNKSVFLYIMGGGILSRCNRLHVFFDVCQSKMHSGYGGFPVSKAMVGSKKAMIFRQQSYGILMVQHSCTVGAGLLHYRCQGAALFLALLFESLYSYEKCR